MASKGCWFYYLIPISMWGKMASVLCKQGIPWSSFQSWWGAVRGCLSTLNNDLRARPFAPEGLICHDLEHSCNLLGLGANELLLGAHLSCGT